MAHQAYRLSAIEVPHRHTVAAANIRSARFEHCEHIAGLVKDDLVET